MTPFVRAVLASSLFVSSVSFAQEVEMDMQVDADTQDMPAARIQIRTSGTDGEGSASVRVRGGTTTTTETRTETRTTTHSGRGHGETVQVREVQSEPSFRDCGTRSDEGCTTRRDGQFPMDASTWRGFYQSLKSESNEIVREEKAGKMLKRVYLTAVQFGMVLDLFNNEITRLDVAKVAAPHVVDPQHALGFSTKWNNSISGSEYTDLITEQ
ncbi:DUF4476 domain-containing protein [Corallococcus sp. CA053C]|uniref:DUF4476 domain-containing protein n=1 Tax=Corallococcus sp. CA053C TaxID=2316732 RepID=UPI000EA1DF7A|nr:DUF4476 domain-containing protein [Corallococcus sp. CA053C]RKH13315.1 DUF4476 domain-containing protein [Corallococcus sp. CA053C]